MNGGSQDTITRNVNPYVNEVNIYMNLTGDSDAAIGNNGASSDITVTIEVDGQAIFSESYDVNKGSTESIQFSINDSETVGEWNLIFESNDGVSDFTYDYNWLSDFEVSS